MSVLTEREFTYQTLSAIDAATILEKYEIADFLYEALGKYGDKKEDILKCLDHALSIHPHQGGFVMLAREAGAIKGAIVINDTGFEGFAPPHIVGYLAVDEDTRGEGLGTHLMKRAMKRTKGDFALHCEYNNPAMHLYEKLGFRSKYAEMRLHRN